MDTVDTRSIEHGLPHQIVYKGIARKFLTVYSKETGWGYEFEFSAGSVYGMDNRWQAIRAAHQHAMNEHVTVMADLKKLLHEMAIYAPRTGAVVAPTAAMGFGWRAASILRALGEEPPKGLGATTLLPTSMGNTLNSPPLEYKP